MSGEILKNINISHLRLRQTNAEKYRGTHPTHSPIGVQAPKAGVTDQNAQENYRKYGEVRTNPQGTCASRMR